MKVICERRCFDKDKPCAHRGEYDRPSFGCSYDWCRGDCQPVKLAKIDKFWMLWVEGTPYTRHRHATEESYRTEAERLAKLTGKKVYVLETVQMVEVPEIPVKWRQI